MTEEQRIRYSRLIAIDEVGPEGVEKLNKATVSVVGCGALGSMAAMQLAASGVGRIRIVDFDTIDLSNLQRQFFYTVSEAGHKKTESLSSKIQALNPDVKVEVYNEMLGIGNARQLVEGCDVVVEATDNHASMTMIDRICEETGRPCVLAGVSGFSGQILTCIPGHKRYSNLFPDPVYTGILPCSIAGVAGPAAAIAASIEVAEAIKSIIGITPLLTDRLLIFDLLNLNFNIVEI